MAFQVIAWVLEARSQHLGRRGFLRLVVKLVVLKKRKKKVCSFMLMKKEFFRSVIFFWLKIIVEFGAGGEKEIFTCK